MNLVGETTPLLGAEQAVDEEAAGELASPTRKKSFPKASQIAALMLITTVWPFSFEMIYPFINQVRFPRVLMLRRLRSPQSLPPNVGCGDSLSWKSELPTTRRMLVSTLAWWKAFLLSYSYSPVRPNSSIPMEPLHDLSFQSCPQVLFLTTGEGSPSYSSERPEWR